MANVHRGWGGRHWDGYVYHPPVRKADVTRLRRLGTGLARALARAGIIEESRLLATVGLAWPRVVTGFAIMSKRTVDLAIVGIAVGPTAVAGLTLANAYWTIGKFAFIGLAGGTIALVSQNYGGGEPDRASRVVEASLLAAVALALPVAGLFVAAARPMVALVGQDPTVLDRGGAYLAFVAPGLVFEGINLVSSRTYAGTGDTTTPMVMRAGGAALNVVLSGAFVFGAGLGVVGAALGTTLSTAAVAVAFAWGMTGRSYFGQGASTVPVRFGRLPEPALFRQLAALSLPLMARRIAQAAVVFPLLAVAATFGPVAVAAVGVSRQVRGLLDSFGWGFSIAASTLVGQALGAGDEALAEAYGREITKLSLLVYVATALVVVGFARPVAAVFVGGEDVRLTAAFVVVAAISVVPMGIDGSITGTLRGAGDTRVPFVATLAGLYLVALPVAWLGTVTALGVVALQAALVAETAVPMVVNGARFATGRWKAISREYRPGGTDADAETAG
ncbi:MATE family efflux transporter [Halobacteriales archaeon QS_1_68_17]|nr:MAG: MATE family efflux transporter [Halobacteriales archaeon QS_1_68_17]